MFNYYSTNDPSVTLRDSDKKLKIDRDYDVSGIRYSSMA